MKYKEISVLNKDGKEKMVRYLRILLTIRKKTGLL